jgi:hypothetical protein
MCMFMCVMTIELSRPAIDLGYGRGAFDDTDNDSDAISGGRTRGNKGLVD